MSKGCILRICIDVMGSSAIVRLLPLLAFICILSLGNTAQAQVQRRVLMEIFSTERCNNCPQAHKNIERLFGDGGDSIIFLGHHAGFYTDNFSLEESIDYEWFYTPNRGTYAPAAMMDRTCGSDLLPNVFTDGVPIFNGAKASCLQPAYEMAAETPAYARVQVETEFEQETRELSISVSGALLRELPMVNDMRLNLFLTEDSVFTQTQSGSIGSYYHRHLARHCFTTSWGEAVEMEGEFIRSYSISLPLEWNERRIQVVAFVTNYNPEDRNNCQVLNAAATTIIHSDNQHISAVQQDEFNNNKYNVLGQKLRYDASGVIISKRRITIQK